MNGESAKLQGLVFILHCFVRVYHYLCPKRRPIRMDRLQDRMKYPHVNECSGTLRTKAGGNTVQGDPVAFRVDEYGHMPMFRTDGCFGDDDLTTRSLDLIQHPLHVGIGIQVD